jgi:hypothetical protein
MPLSDGRREAARRLLHGANEQEVVSSRKVVTIVSCAHVALKVTLKATMLGRPFDEVLLSPFLRAYNKRCHQGAAELSIALLSRVEVNGTPIAAFDAQAGTVLGDHDSPRVTLFAATGSAATAPAAAVATPPDPTVGPPAPASTDAAARHDRDATSTAELVFQATTGALELLLPQTYLPVWLVNPPVEEFGLAVSQDAPAALEGPHAVFAAALLTRRAAAALRLGLTLRALSDSRASLLLRCSQRNAFWRARALLTIGACGMAAEVLTHVIDSSRSSHSSRGSYSRGVRLSLALALVRNAAVREGCRIPKHVRRLMNDPSWANVSAPPELAFVHSALRVATIGDGRGRGWVAMQPVEAGSLLLLEPRLFPLSRTPGAHADGMHQRHARSSGEEPLPLLRATVDAIGRGGGRSSNRLRELAHTLHPIGGVEGDHAHGLEDEALRRPIVDEIGAAGNLGAEETRVLDLKIQRNQMQMCVRVAGSLVDVGTSVFPLVALFNHSCRAHAGWWPVCGGTALAVRANRKIEPGEEVTIPYLPLSMHGPNRRESLRETHGFVCRCERCTAPAGSACFEREQLERALMCDKAYGGSSAVAAAEGDGAGSSIDDEFDIDDRHLLLPEDPYALRPSFSCRVPGCCSRMTAEEAQGKLERVLQRFKELHSYVDRAGAVGEEEADASSCSTLGCAAARAAEAFASRVLGPLHHAWPAWTAAAMVLADDGDGDTPLLLAAYRRREAALVAERAEDEDIFVRINHALVVGIDSAAAAPPLRTAFALDRVSSGVDIEGFLSKWIPADLLDAVADDVRRVLRRSSAPATTQEGEDSDADAANVD